MSLLKRIHSKNVWWFYNNRPYVEPTDEQKAKQEKERLLMERSSSEFISSLSRLACMFPQAFERTADCMRIAKEFSK